MKLNHDCVRDVMLSLEEKLEYGSYYLISLADKESEFEYPIEDVLYSLEKLHEAGFIEANISKFLDGGRMVRVFSISWYGHQFLDNIRPPTAWEKTKGILSRIGGGSLSVASDISGKVISELIKGYL